MNISDEIRKLQELHDRGALTDDEFSQAKAAVLAGASRPADSGEGREIANSQLEILRIQNQIAQLDREWEIESQGFMMRGRYGQQYRPSKWGGLIVGLVAVVGGGIWTVTAFSMSSGMERAPGAFSLFPYFGFVFIAFGVGIGVYTFVQANRYEEAYAKYQARRTALLHQNPRV
jgi:Short C-terminal domain